MPTATPVNNETLSEHYDRVAKGRAECHAKNAYFHKEILNYYTFLIPEGSRILELGCGAGDLIGRLRASRAVGVDISEEMITRGREKFPKVEFICGNVESFESEETFDFIIVSGTLSSVRNIQDFFQRLHRFSSADTRILVDYYNELWSPVISLAERTGRKTPEIISNWLSVDDIENFLFLSNHQVIKRSFLCLLPIKLPLLSTLFNRVLAKVPILRRFCLMQAVIARPLRRPGNADDLSCSIVLTCRDEEDNIKGLVSGIPDLGKHTEIIFVEGHSKDRTVERIKEVIHQYPNKDIKLFHQKGIGQADAYRLGFSQAKGDLLCWLEADLTIPPEEIRWFWEAYVSGRGEYMNGTRFIYKMEKNSMPFFNFIGNRFFGNLFTMILEQRFTDTLCGFKALSRHNYQKISTQLFSFGDFDPFGDFELIFGAIKCGLKAVEIPVHYRPRTYGAPKAYGKGFFSFLKHAWLLFRMSWVAFVKIKLR